MLSVCIPVYNTNVQPLVASLVQQLHQTPVAWEILLADDGSTYDVLKRENESVQHIVGVQFFFFETNRGRAAARNFLAEKARHAWLLFLDADSVLLHDAFISNYLETLGNENKVIVGGRICGPKPTECNKQLHWKYGTTREAATGLHKPAFASNNFCIAKKHMQAFSFNVSLTGWGHEDTDFGLQLKQAHISIEFINNPVLHAQLENAHEFLQKSKSAAHNLLQLAQQWGPAVVAKEVKLYRWYRRVKKLRLDYLLLPIWQLAQKKLHTHLSGCNPRLWLFDFYRLGSLLSITKDK